LGALQYFNDFRSDMAERFQAYVAVFNARNVIDILLVAVLIYFAIQLLRRSNAFSVLKGVFVFVLVLFLSQIFQLYTLYFLLMSTLQVGLIALIVLFQPEIRKMLGQVGAANLPIGRADTSEKSINETADACVGLSKARQGALIVFERKVVLSDFSETGTQLDASVTSSLLKNIFYPKAPLHDGAVIIRHGRITGAGCMLPLTNNQIISRDLGMRHRAGIGMSENSDAVVVVVSEETGSISAAIGGMLKRHLSPETLEKLLRQELLPSDPNEGKKGIGAVITRMKKSKKKGG
jgi:diadenylate cyclase